MRINKTSMAIVIACMMAITSCQDHHYTPYDEMGPLPTPDPGRKVSAPPLKGAPSASSAPAAGIVVAGSINLAPEASSLADPTWILYIIARPTEGGTPVAASRKENVTFPMQYSLTEKDIMMKGVPPGTEITVEARLDSDGDPMTKDEIDLFGKVAGNVRYGQKNVVITLGKQPK